MSGSLKTISFEVSMNPYGWVYAVDDQGRTVTKDMVSFDTDRGDVQVNEHGVVLFYDVHIAKALLKPDAVEDRHTRIAAPDGFFDS